MPNLPYRWYVIVFVSLFFMGCLSGGMPQATERIHTRIIENGRKFFEFSLIINVPIPLNGDHTSGNAESFDRGRRYRVFSILTERMELKLREIGYCRKGFFEIERYFDGHKATLVGECLDTATTRDRRKFKNDFKHDT